MANWEKLKVTDLKEELKSRGIPLTGLKLKQQLIDKLNEVDGDNFENSSAPDGQHEDEVDDIVAAHAEHTGNKENGDTTPTTSSGVQTLDVSPNSEPNLTTERKLSSTASSEITQTGEREVVKEKPSDSDNDNNHLIPSTNEITDEERVDRLPDELPIELKQEESQARDGSTPPPAEAMTKIEEKALGKDDPFVLQENTEPISQTDVAHEDSESLSKVKDATIQADNTGTRSSGQAGDFIEQINIPLDQSDSSSAAPDREKKRKRRSLTPVLDADNAAHKKQRMNNGTPVPTQRESDALKKIQDVTNAAQAIRNADSQINDTEMDSAHRANGEETLTRNDAPVKQEKKDVIDQPRRQTGSSPRPRLSPDKDVSPAIHPATQSLYIRNFKRPLHIPSLRSHIGSLAGSTEGDPIDIFYLDSIRTHAFVSLSSSSAAARVRNAMHGSRFPDEPMRDPLWIDFVPSEKIQTWISQETGNNSNSTSAGGRGVSKKFEVIYEKRSGGVEAILQEVSSNNAQAQRPELQASRSNRMVPQDPSASAAVASGIHPARLPLVSRSPTNSRDHSQPKAQTRPSDPGKGFHALDELFSSSTAKPKLYFKLPTQAVIDDRLDMIRNLRVMHNDMGQSGDEGMKRYSFEKDERTGHEDWVDKGPEFGFGRRGQERLTGYGSTYGGGRGRGGFRGSRRGGDSWRGR